MSIVTTLPTVQFTIIAPAGYRILDSLRFTAIYLSTPLVITCGCEGHPLTDPHTLGEAYDVRSHDFGQAMKDAVLKSILHALVRGDDDAVLTAAPSGLATRRFFGWLEHPGQPNEHFHIQRRKGTIYTITDFLAGR